MAYVHPNFKTKKALREALRTGLVFVDVFDPAGMHPPPRDGRVHLEGPHYPEPHKWYAQGEMKDGKLISIK